MFLVSDTEQYMLMAKTEDWKVVISKFTCSKKRFKTIFVTAPRIRTVKYITSFSRVMCHQKVYGTNLELLDISSSISI